MDRVPTGLEAAAGLDAREVADRRARYGENTILVVRRGGWWALVRDTATDPMIWFLAATGAVYAAIGERIEALVLVAAIVPLAAMDAALHRRATASMQGLASRLAERAVVRRDGIVQTIASVDVVPGDVALVAPGESFPADGVLLDVDDAQVDESTLTGESEAVRKRACDLATLAGAEPSVDGRHWGLAGTRMLAGAATVLVVFTGAETVYGTIARSAAETSQARTPLQHAIARLVSALVVVAIAICALLAGVRVAQGHGWLDATLAAVTLAVAAIPEEFPVVFAFYLGVGVHRLARRHALVRRAVSVENVGRVTTICSDKTGTITSGELVLAHVVPAPPVEEMEVMLAASLAARPETGDPVDHAIAVRARSAGAGQAAWRTAARFPFTEDRKRETVVVTGAASADVARAAPRIAAALGAGPGDDPMARRALAVTKGAPEVVLAACASSEADAASWRARVTDLAATGHKVIAVACRALDLAEDEEPREPRDGYVLAGLLAFEDPVRDGVADAVRSCVAAGIRPIMVTGDHPATARAVAREIGLGGADPVVVAGDEVEARIARGDGGVFEVDVVARALPAHKVALVRGFQDAGAVVAVTGDGVNDVPALKRADVGIAMGERGTQTAREVAAIVLLDDNFRTIVAAIAEGRQLFRNLRLSFAYLLAVHVPLVATAAVVPLAGFPLLYLPIHIVWIEMVIHPTALLAFQEAGAVLRPDRHAAARRPRFFTAREWVAIGACGALTTLLVVLAYLHGSDWAGDVERGRSAALVVLLAASAGITAALSRGRTRAAGLVVAAVVASTVGLLVPAVAELLHAAALDAADFAVLLVLGLVVAPLPLVGALGAGGDRQSRASR